MQQKQSSKQSWKHKVVIIISIGLLSSLFYLGFRYINNTFRVRIVKFKTQSAKTLIGISSLNNLFIPLISKQEIENDLLSQNPTIASVNVSIVYPDTIEIVATPARGFAYIKTEATYILMTKTGRITLKESKKTKELPVITYYQKIPYSEIVPGNVISFKEITQTLYILQQLSKINIIPDTVDIDGRDMIALLLGSKKIFFSSSKESDPQIYQLERIITQFRIEGKEYVRIDLRFNRPIIEFAP